MDSLLDTSDAGSWKSIDCRKFAADYRVAVASHKPLECAVFSTHHNDAPVLLKVGSRDQTSSLEMQVFLVESSQFELLIFIR